jgi:hypothetical protein
MFFEAPLDHGEREGRAVDWDVDLGDEIGDAADVILMGMSEDEGADLLAIVLEIGKVGSDDIDTEEFGVWEHHTRVDDDNVVVKSDGHGVHAELAKTAEGDYLKLATGHVIAFT